MKFRPFVHFLFPLQKTESISENSEIICHWDGFADPEPSLVVIIRCRELDLGRDICVKESVVVIEPFGVDFFGPTRRARICHFELENKLVFVDIRIIKLMCVMVDVIVLNQGRLEPSKREIRGDRACHFRIDIFLIWIPKSEFYFTILNVGEIIW